MYAHQWERFDLAPFVTDGGSGIGTRHRRRDAALTGWCGGGSRCSSSDSEVQDQRGALCRSEALLRAWTSPLDDSKARYADPGLDAGATPPEAEEDTGPEPIPPPGSPAWDLINSGDANGACGVLHYSDCGKPDPTIVKRPTDTVPGRLEGLDLEGYWPDCDREFLARVWGVLFENQDLAWWAVCLVNRDAASCVVSWIDGSRWKEDGTAIDVELSYDCDWGMFTTSNPPHIRICNTNESKWAQASAVWCCDESDQAARDCAVLLVATSLLHELTHLCGFHDPTFTGDSPNPCSEGDPYLVGQYFAWAMLNRYPAATKPGGAPTGCCTDFKLWAVSPRAAVGDTVPHISCSADCMAPGPTPPGPGGAVPVPTPRALEPLEYTDQGGDWTIFLDGVAL